MSLEKAMILRARPHMFVQRLAAILQTESLKGCEAEISSEPIPIEPPYLPLEDMGRSAASAPPLEHYELGGSADDLRRLRIWISPEETFDWNRSELWLKQMASLSHRIAFHIAGNGDQESKRIEIVLLCHAGDMPVIVAAFESQFGLCEIRPTESDLLGSLDENAWRSVHFHEFYPPPPYSHNLTTHDELRVSPLGAVLTAMRNVPPPAVAFYQCIFQPVRAEHNWHHNVALLVDTEYVFKLSSSPSAASRTALQTPSGDLRQMARDVEVKAHNDKPFFAATVRVGFIGEAPIAEEWLRVFGSAINVIQHGGRPLRYVTHRDYLRQLSCDRMKDTILYARTHRCGFIVNSKELTGLVHIPPASILKPREIPAEVLPSVHPRGGRLADGTVIGTCRYAGRDIQVCISDAVRRLSTHMVANHGMGKSILEVNMFLQDIERHGGMFIDAHGDAIKDILPRVTRKLWPRTVYFNPGDRNYVPLWNPMRLPPGGDVCRLAADMVSIFRRVSKDWGDRLDYIIRYGAIGLEHLPNTCVMDLYNLVRHRSSESKQLTRQILGVVRDETVKNFFARDFDHDYSKGEVQAPKHKLAKLLAGGTVLLMLSQIESLIDFALAMKERLIILVDLSDLDADLIELLGPLVLLSAFMAARGRSRTEREDRIPFPIFVDEAHLYVASDAIEKLISEARKFGLHLCLAHQYLKQFNAGKLDALGTVGTTIIGRVDENDAHFLAKSLQGLVKADDLMGLEPYEMIARIGTDIVRLKTLQLPEPPEGASGEEIIEESRRRYYRPVNEVREMIARRRSEAVEPFAPLVTPGPAFSESNLRFDEW